MNARMHYVISAVIVTATCCLGTLAIRHQLLLPAYQRHEEAVALDVLRRCTSAIDKVLQDLARNAADYAQWDDAYQFVDGTNPDFVQRNLQRRQLLDSLGIDGYCILNRESHPLAATVYTEAGEFVPDVPWTEIGPTADAAAPSEALGGRLSGVLVTSQGPLLFGLHPITTTEAGGPTIGRFVMLRRVDRRLLSEISALVGCPVSALSPSTAPRPAWAADLFNPSSGRFLIHHASPTEMNLAARFSSPDGKPVFALAATLPRDVAAQARRAAYMLAVMMAVLGIMATTAGWLLLYHNNLLRHRSVELAASRTRLIEEVQQHHLDTIERDQTQRALSASEARYRHLVESSQDLIWEVDAAGHYRYVSPQARSILGMDPADLIGLTPFDLMPIEEADRVRREFQRLRKLAAPIVGLRNINIHRDGRQIILETSASPVLDEKGLVVGYRGIDRNITDQERARQDAEILRDRFDSLLRALPIPLFAKDRECRYLFFNPAYESFMGVRPQDLIGRTAPACWPPADAMVYEQHDRDLLARGDSQSYEHTVTTAAGVQRHVLFTKACMHDSAGRVSGIVGTMVDLTEREMAQRERDRLSAELRNTAALLEAVLNAIPDAITVMTPDRTVVRQNLAASGIGFALDPDTCSSCFQRFHRDTPCEPCVVSQTLAARGPVQFARQLPELDRWIDARGYPLLNEQGQVSLIIEHLRDITHDKKAADERRAMDERLRHTQKLESLGALAGGIAHDFNNLLVGMLGNADLALTMLPRHSDVRPLVTDIKEASRRAADLCRQMLAFSGRGRFIVEPICLNALLHDMAAILDASVTRKARLERKIAPALPLIEADTTQIRQIVINLLTNASEALPADGGVITLSTGVTHADRATLDALSSEPEIAEGSYVYLEVTDTGAGMDTATRERMFEPFFSTKFTGRGLGLAAVLGIVRAHHGAIRVDSTPGQGTCVRVLFPVYAPARTAPATASPAPGMRPSRGHGVVLLVDDEELVREVGARMLAQLGYNVELASDGEEAIRMVAERARPFDAVILDLTMPRMDGAQTLVALRARQPALRVILSSGYSQQDATARTPQAQWSAFLQKPYQLDALRQVLQALATEPAPEAPASSQA